MAAQGEKEESRAQQQQQQQLLPTVERTQQVLAPQMTAGKSVEQVVAQDQGATAATDTAAAIGAPSTETWLTAIAHAPAKSR